MIAPCPDLLALVMPRIAPMFVLQVVVGITLAAAILYRSQRFSRQRALTALARQWEMQYNPRDTFNLGPRIAPLLPVPGAADIHVSDVIYGTEADGHRYIFCAEYTVGVVRAKKRQRSVLSVLEPRKRVDGHEWSSLRVAMPEVSLLDQYRSLAKQQGAAL